MAQKVGLTKNDTFKIDDSYQGTQLCFIYMKATSMFYAIAER